MERDKWNLFKGIGRLVHVTLCRDQLENQEKYLNHYWNNYLMIQQIPCHKTFSALQILQYIIYTLAPSRVTINTDTEQHYDFMNSHPYYSVCLIRLSNPHKSRPGLINSQPLMYYAIAWHPASGALQCWRILCFHSPVYGDEYCVS